MAPSEGPKPCLCFVRGRRSAKRFSARAAGDSAIAPPLYAVKSTGLRSDRQQIARGVELLFPDGFVGEVRIVYPNGNPIWAGYFNDRTKALEEVLKHDGLGNVYATLNPVDKALLARADNRLVRNLKPLTSDKDTLCRRHILFDLDAVRPAGISATDDKHAAALLMADRVSSWLCELGFPRSILADSGNGAHVLVRIDEPNDAVTTEIIKQCLARVSAVHSTLLAPE